MNYRELRDELRRRWNIAVTELNRQLAKSGIRTGFTTLSIGSDEVHRILAALGEAEQAQQPCASHPLARKTPACTVCVETTFDAYKERISELDSQLADLKDDAKWLEGACWYCLNPDIGPPERHIHEVDGKPDVPHWHHYIDPGDGLPSPCKNSDRFEEVFQELHDQLAERDAQLQKAEALLRRYYDCILGGDHTQIVPLLDETKDYFTSRDKESQ